MGVIAHPLKFHEALLFELFQREDVRKHQRRYERNLKSSRLSECGSPPATMFCWAPLPAPLREMGSLEFSKLLLEEAQVAVAPGIGFGEYGEGFVRLGLVENEHRTRQAVRNIKAFLKSLGINDQGGQVRNVAS